MSGDENYDVHAGNYKRNKLQSSSEVSLAGNYNRNKLQSSSEVSLRHRQSCTENTAFSEMVFRLIKKENELLTSLRLCLICHVKQRDITFLPCGHFDSCKGCADNIDICPGCGTRIKATVVTYLS
ncbi:hypothetical protein BsWGS_18503 [Bradybaena similaris]